MADATARADAPDPTDPFARPRPVGMDAGPAGEVADEPDGWPDPPRPPDATGRFAGLAEVAIRARDDPRLGALALAALAVVAGLVWYRAQVGADPAAPSASSAAAAAGGTTADLDGAPVPEPGAGDAAEGSAGGGPAGPATTTTTAAPGPAIVHVAGAVERPGIVTLPPGSRVADAIDAAGGPEGDADLDRLNLAAPVGDGQRVLVARIGDPPTPAEPQPPAGTGGPADPAAPDPPIDLNTATEQDLQALPGIGPVLASAIVEERVRRGGFTDVGQLRSVRGIGDQRFADLRDRVTV